MTDTKREMPEIIHACSYRLAPNEGYFSTSNMGESTEYVRADLAARVSQVPEASDKWISVEDRLPEAKIEIMTVLIYREDVGFSFGEYGGDFWYDVRENEVVDDVTHWMPLPEPPRACERLNRKEEL